MPGQPIFFCVSHLLDHDGERSEHLEAPCEVHDVAPSQHQGEGHGHHLPSCAGETHHHGHQDHAGICDAARKKRQKKKKKKGLVKEILVEPLREINPEKEYSKKMEKVTHLAKESSRENDRQFIY